MIFRNKQQLRKTHCTMCNLKSTPERNEKQADRAIPRVTQRQRTFEIIRRSPDFSLPGTKKEGDRPLLMCPAVLCTFTL